MVNEMESDIIGVGAPPTLAELQCWCVGNGSDQSPGFAMLHQCTLGVCLCGGVFTVTRWRLSGLTTLEIVLMRSVCWWRERRQVGGEGVSGGAGCLLRGICVHSGFLTVHKVKALSLKFSVGLKPRSVSTYIKTDTYELCMCVLSLFCQQMPPNWFPYEMAKLQKL